MRSPQASGGDQDLMRDTGCARIDGVFAFPQVAYRSTGVLCRFVQFVGADQSWVRSVLSAMRKSAWASRFSGGDAVAGWLCTNRRRSYVCPGGFSVGGGVVSIRTIRGYPPTMGMGVVVRDAESARGSPAALVSQKLTSVRFSLAVSPGRQTPLSAFTRPPPPRQQTR